MALMDIGAAITTDNNNITRSAGNEPWNKEESKYIIDDVETETRTYQPDFTKWHGLYRNVPFYKNTVDKLMIWTMGKEFDATKEVKKILMAKTMVGNGMDSFISILNNLGRTYKFNGDSQAEILRNTAGRLVNLKPLNPGTIRTRANNKGVIIKYEQMSNQMTSESTKQGNVLNSWDPHEIFHLSNMRIADEIHGIPLSESLQSIIKKWENIMDVMYVVYVRYVQPFLDVKTSTDDPTELAEITATLKERNKNMENLVSPEQVVEINRIAIPQFATLDPLPWIQMLQSHFIMSSGVPDIILGHSREASEATAKIIYLAFQQTIEWEQLYIQDQVLRQLGQKINLKFPASIDPSLLADSRKNSGDKVTNNNPVKAE